MDAVRSASDGLPGSFGGTVIGKDLPPPLAGSFKTRLLAVFVSALISRRKVRGHPCRSTRCAGPAVNPAWC